jgi:hypothetical protein
MLFCQSCGKSQPDAAKFCAQCGARLAEDDLPVPNPVDVLEDAPVKILDGGDKIVFSGSDASQVEAMLQKYLRRGAKVITPLSAVGRSWAAACTVPPASRSVDETQTLNLAEIVLPPIAPAPPPAAPQDGCRVEEMGLKRLVYGPSRAEVEKRLLWLKHQGAEIVGAIEQDGAEWVGVCDLGGQS